MESKLMSMKEVAATLASMTFMIGSESEEMQAAGVACFIGFYMETAKFVGYMSHIQTCTECAFRHHLTGMVLSGRHSEHWMGTTA